MTHLAIALVVALGASTAALADVQLATSVSAMGGSLCSASGSSSAQCSFMGVDYLNGGTLPSPYFGVLGATAGFGHLTSDMAVASSLSHFGTSVAAAGFRDELTALGSGAGFIRYELTVSRDFVTWFKGYDLYLTQGGNTPDHFTTGPCCSSGDNHGTIAYQSSLYPVTFGVPFQLAVNSQAYMWLDQAEIGWNHFDLAVSNIWVYDAQKNLISAPLVSKSGTVYATPEPAGIILLLTTVALAGALALKRRPARR